MREKLTVAFDKLEVEKAKILSSVATLNATDFAKGPKDRWSISQILTHIYTSEMLALRYMQKKSLGLDGLENSGWMESAKLVALKISQRIPIKYKAPKVILDKTPPPMALDQLQSVWTNERKLLQQFLHSIPEKHQRKKIFKHPIAGMFDAGQGLTFMLEHLKHHLPQIHRLLK